MKSDLEELEAELSQDLENLDVDLSLSDNYMLQIYQSTRLSLVAEYQKLMIHAKLNDVVENAKLSTDQREAAKKLVRQIASLDKDMKEVKARADSQENSVR